MDMWACARDTRIVSALGRSRQRLAGVLNSAFAEGLLSEQTHSYRLRLLFAPRLVDPPRLPPPTSTPHALTAALVPPSTPTRSAGPDASSQALTIDWNFTDENARH